MVDTDPTQTTLSSVFAEREETQPEILTLVGIGIIAEGLYHTNPKLRGRVEKQVARVLRRIEDMRDRGEIDPSIPDKLVLTPHQLVGALSQAAEGGVAEAVIEHTSVD